MMTERTEFSGEAFRAAPIVGILRGIPTATTLAVARRYAAAGLTTLEVTMNSPGALESIAAIREARLGLNVGAGTVCTPTDLENALAAGAHFIVTPILSEAVIKGCTRRQIPVFPGAYTPTEIYRAWELGATMVKIFPATRLGPGYVRDLLGPLDQLELLPTGGVSAENLTEFFRAGARGVGMGSSLFPKSALAAGDLARLSAHFDRIMALLKDR